MPKTTDIYDHTISVSQQSRHGLVGFSASGSPTKLSYKYQPGLRKVRLPSSLSWLLVWFHFWRIERTEALSPWCSWLEDMLSSLPLGFSNMSTCFIKASKMSSKKRGVTVFCNLITKAIVSPWCCILLVGSKLLKERGLLRVWILGMIWGHLRGCQPHKHNDCAMLSCIKQMDCSQ